MTAMRMMILALCLCFTSIVAGEAQGRKSQQLRRLEQQRTEQIKRIEEKDKEIKALKKTEANENKRLKLVREHIQQKDQLIGILTSEVGALQQQMDSLGGQLTILGSKEQRLREQYRLSLRSLQRKDRDAELLLFLFSARDLEEAMRRQLFTRQYTRSSREILDSLRVVRQGLQETKTTLGAYQTEKKKLVELRDKEKQALSSEETRRLAQVQRLQSEQSKLEAELRQAQQEARQLERRIEQQIAAEIKHAQEQARKAREARLRRASAAKRPAPAPKPAAPTSKPSSAPKGKGSPAPRAEKPRPEPQPKSEDSRETDAEERRADTEGGYAMDRAERTLAGSFRQNKGRLPMPIRGRYQLVYRFGKQPHHTLRHVEVVKGGVDLRPLQDKKAYAVFSGTVSSVLVTSGYGTSVILRHGNYLTVYSNLSGVSVRSGQQVRPGQALGTIATPAGESGPLLHFQLWHEQRNQDPWPWLKK